jgi:UPF0716 protein FxsA
VLLRLLLLFTLVPLIELYILIRVGEVIGVWATIALVICTGILGASLTRLEAIRVFRQVQAELRNGRVPTAGLLDGLLVVVAGAVLLTPGLITDILGFLLLFPPSRRRVRDLVVRAASRRFGDSHSEVIDVGWRREGKP